VSARSSIQRRTFLKTGATAVGGLLAGPYLVPASALGADGPAPSDRLNLGFIGLGTQGRGHLTGGAWTMLPGGFLGRRDVQVIAVCDVVRARREDARQVVDQVYAERFGRGSYRGCHAYTDFRELLARPDIDAVVIATPNHWHAPMSILAARAGKDVYCEKPTALTIREGRAVVEAMATYGRVYQAGTQQRSEYQGRFRTACEWVRSGRIGPLQRVYSYQTGGRYEPDRGGAARPIPDGLDWELWLGPAPWRAFDGNLSSQRFGVGDINWGQHHYDIVQWGVGADRSGPVRIDMVDGKIVYHYASGVEVYGCPPPGQPWMEGGACFIGSEGKIVVHRNVFYTDPPEIARRPPADSDVRLYHCDSHAGNFLECMRSRQRTIVDAETAQRAVSVLLLGGIAMALDRPLRWNPETEQFLNDPEADRLLSRTLREPWRI
jgi:predicted dehydrogenase